MKVLLVAHGYPPELVGGTEKSVQALAHGLAARGVEVVVVAGSIEHEEGFRTSTADDGGVRVIRIHRADLFFDHWQKSASARRIAWEGIPAVVTLHDFWTTCLINFRVRPDTLEFCEVPLGPTPCLDCAALIPPRTPWVAREQQMMALFQRKEELARELLLARIVIAPSRSHARVVERFLGLGEGALGVRAVPHGRDLGLRAVEPPAPPGDGNRLVLGSWSNLHPVKGFDLVLAAIRALPEPDRVTLHVAGGGVLREYEAQLVELARDLDVTFHGSFAVDQLDRHPVANVHAMVSGTRAEESWGLVVDEAAALRLPMVLPRSGAFPERLAEGAGVLFYEPRDAVSLAGVLRRLLDEPGLLPSLRDTLPPLEQISPSVEAHVAELLGLYREAADAGAPERPAEEWWRDRMQRQEEESWDASLSGTPAEGLGFA
ncbi:MAG: glycosyltransferase [Planctomycetota bacterium]|nr:glycosyltransferase [Planctomycetota bacterium]